MHASHFPQSQFRFLRARFYPHLTTSPPISYQLNKMEHNSYSMSQSLYNLSQAYLTQNKPQFQFESNSNLSNYSYEDIENFMLFNNDTMPNLRKGSLLRSNLPPEYSQLSTQAWVWIIAYFIVFVLASVGNLIEFCAVWKRIKIRKTNMNILLMNLCVADLLVVVFVAAVEIGWRLSVGWYAGRVMCKCLQFFRAFSLYLSSLVLICLTVDRWFAVLYPLKVVDAGKRVKILLILAWVGSALLASPQCIVFDVKQHPKYPAFTQCMGDELEEANTILSICFMYFLPFLLIVFCYGSIIYKLTKDNDALSSVTATSSATERLHLRRSDKELMARTKHHALKLTFTIVIVFILTWTPYIIITTWHIYDRESAEKLNPQLQEALFIMVVANSMANPMVYGVFHGSRKNGSRGPLSGICRRGNHSATNLNRTPSTAYSMTTYCHGSTKRSVRIKGNEIINGGSQALKFSSSPSPLNRNFHSPHSPSPPTEVTCSNANGIQVLKPVYDSYVTNKNHDNDKCCTSSV